MIEWHGNAKFSHEFPIFRPTEDMEIKSHSNTSYISVTTSSNSENIPHTNLIQDSFKIEAKVMETSDLIAWNCKSSTYGFLGFIPTENKDMKLQSKKSYISVTKS